MAARFEGEREWNVHGKGFLAAPFLLTDDAGDRTTRPLEWGRLEYRDVQVRTWGQAVHCADARRARRLRSTARRAPAEVPKKRAQIKGKQYTLLTTPELQSRPTTPAKGFSPRLRSSAEQSTRVLSLLVHLRRRLAVSADCCASGIVSREVACGTSVRMRARGEWRDPSKERAVFARRAAWAARTSPREVVNALARELDAADPTLTVLRPPEAGA